MSKVSSLSYILDFVRATPPLSVDFTVLRENTLSPPLFADSDACSRLEQHTGAHDGDELSPVLRGGLGQGQVGVGLGDVTGDPGEDSATYFRLLFVSVVWKTLEADIRFSMYWPRTWFSDFSFKFSSFTASTRADRSAHNGENYVKWHHICMYVCGNMLGHAYEKPYRSQTVYWVWSTVSEWRFTYVCFDTKNVM